jgi:hypothetical protein
MSAAGMSKEPLERDYRVGRTDAHGRFVYIAQDVRTFLVTLAKHRELPFGIADEAFSLLRRCGPAGAEQAREIVARGIWDAYRRKAFPYHYRVEDLRVPFVTWVEKGGAAPTTRSYTRYRLGGR